MTPMVAESVSDVGRMHRLSGKLLTAADSDPCALGREALNMVLLLLKEALGDEQGHGHVFMSGPA